MTEPQHLDIEGLAKYVDGELLKKIHDLLEGVSCSNAEMTLAAALAQSIGHSCDNATELQDNFTAYVYFIKNVATGQFLFEKGDKVEPINTGPTSH